MQHIVFLTGRLAEPSLRRVLADIAPEGEAKCPYCSTVYQLRGGPVPGAHVGNSNT